jgi:hypothetical protein
LSSTALTNPLSEHVSAESASPLRRLLTPSFSDCFFVALICWLFLSSPHGWTGLLLDGDSGWHIRTGDSILANGSVPRQDLFSFSKPGETWFAWEWGVDVLYSLLHSAWGLKAIALLGGVLIVLFATVLFRFMLWRGSNPLLALALALLATGASSIHFLARPHLFTLVLLPACLWILERDRRAPDSWVWILIPITAVWTNLHGGFLALVACLGLLVAGTGLETLLATERDWSRLRRYSFLAGFCGAASFINPYGWHLHAHILAYLRSDWIREAVMEFQSPKFRQENVFQFQILMFLSLLACWPLLSRRRITESLWILFWAHQALGAVRHITVFVAIAAPILAVEATRLWSSWVEPSSRKSIRRILDTVAREVRPKFLWTSLWPAVFVLALTGIDQVKWPNDFPDFKFPVDVIERHEKAIRSSRVFTTDQWADYLIYRHYPEQKVFFDGRSDFFGPELGRAYVNLSNGHWEWRRILDRHRFQLALVPPELPLAALLKEDKQWRLLMDSGKALLFERVASADRSSAQASPNNSPKALMKSIHTSEFSMGDLMPMKRARQSPRNNPETRVKPSSRYAWSLPSGQGLGEYALRGGFVAPGSILKLPFAAQAGSQQNGLNHPGVPTKHSEGRY